MGYKIFITYKYGDSDVLSLNRNNQTTVRDYVSHLQDDILSEDHINKGEADGTDLSHLKDEQIASKLRDKIYDSSITLVMISKNMKSSLPEDDQWIPWEISYSLKEHARDGITSRTNAMLAIVLPDKNGESNYFLTDDACQLCHCRWLNTNYLFSILRKNMFNLKELVPSKCTNHLQDNKPYLGDSSYIHSVKWDDFIANPNQYLKKASDINDKIDDYNISKTI
jgi:hypothetical protein